MYSHHLTFVCQFFFKSKTNIHREVGAPIIRKGNN